MIPDSDAVSSAFSRIVNCHFAVSDVASDFCEVLGANLVHELGTKMAIEKTCERGPEQAETSQKKPGRFHEVILGGWRFLDTTISCRNSGRLCMIE
jgi:hypothetical protein